MARPALARKLAISIDAAVYDSVRQAAAAEGISVSAWMTRAARQALRVRDGLTAVSDWEAEHGELSEAELAAARRRVTAERLGEATAGMLAGIAAARESESAPTSSSRSA